MSTILQNDDATRQQRTQFNILWINTYTTTFLAASGESCYHDECGITSFHYGPCGCPNECFTSFGYGTCNESSGTCLCNPGWTGKDCRLPTSGNLCSLHGQVILPTDKNSQLPYSYCHCDEGLTGNDCSTPVFTSTTLASTPWGTIFSGKEYTSKDKYGDNHPIWNMTQIATIHLELDETDYLHMIQPTNELNETYTLVKTFTFENNYIKESLSNVGIRLKGLGCRSQHKKCWAIKFNEFKSGQFFYDMKRLGFKSGDNDDDILAKELLYVNMMRATGTPTQRTSYALLYVNNIFMGLYFIHEDNDEVYVDNRLPNDDGSGNYYKFNGNVYMQYHGSDVEIYQNDSNYEQKSGNGDWTDLVDFFTYLSTTSDEEFEKTIEDHMNIDYLFQNMIVESFMLGTDGMTRNGRNYNLYHLTDEKYPNKWFVMDYDFDLSFEFDRITGEPYIGVSYLDIFGFFMKDRNANNYNPLLNRLLVIPQYNQTYLNMYSQFIEALFGSKSPIQPSVLHSQRMQFVLPWAKRDRMWTLSCGNTAQNFVSSTEYTCKRLNERYVNVTMQIQSYSSF